MSSVIDRARAHFSGLATNSVEVPEWGEAGKPLVIHWQPWTLAERDAVYQKAEQAGLGLFARALVAKALDENGKRLFAEADFAQLSREVSSDVIVRVGTIIWGTPAMTKQSVGEAAKN